MAMMHSSPISLLRSSRHHTTAKYSNISHLLTRRSYFSVHHPHPPPFPAAQDKILSCALNRVPQYGFTEEALTLGSRDAGYLDVSVQLFPRGVFELINYHLVSQRLALKDGVQFPQSTHQGLTSKVRTLAMARLRANRDIIHQWQGVSRDRASFGTNDS